VRHGIPDAERSKALGHTFERGVVEPEDEVPIPGEGLRPMMFVNSVRPFELRDPSTALDLGSTMTADLRQPLIPETVAVVRLVVQAAKDGSRTSEPFDDPDQRRLARRRINDVDPSPIPGGIGLIQVEGEERPPLRLEQMRQRGANVPAQPDLNWTDALLGASLPEHDVTLAMPQSRLPSRPEPE
jgi:hypothetical protein